MLHKQNAIYRAVIKCEGSPSPSYRLASLRWSNGLCRHKRLCQHKQFNSKVQTPSFYHTAFILPHAYTLHSQLKILEILQPSKIATLAKKSFKTTTSKGICFRTNKLSSNKPPFFQLGKSVLIASPTFIPRSSKASSDTGLPRAAPNAEGSTG